MAYYNNLANDFGGMNLGPDGRRHDPYSAPRNDYPPSHAYPGDHTRPADPYRQNSEPRSDYSSPPPVPGPRPGDYGARPPPPYAPPADKPPIPSGWRPRWDDHHQRWYYVEEATGRSQWEAPGYHPERSAAYSPPAGGYDGQGTPAYSGYGSPPREQKRGNSGMLMGAAGGLAAGAIGGALLANAFDDDDHHSQHYAAPPAAPPSYSNPPVPQDPGVPLYNADGEYISGSDRESVEEAREEYLEALDDARSSSASSSDREALEEAREEYEEEYEEAYYDD